MYTRKAKRYHSGYAGDRKVHKKTIQRTGKRVKIEYRANERNPEFFKMAGTLYWGERNEIEQRKNENGTGFKIPDYPRTIQVIPPSDTIFRKTLIGIIGKNQ